MTTWTPEQTAEYAAAFCAGLGRILGIDAEPPTARQIMESAKLERCVSDVKKNGSGNVWAICRASLGECKVEECECENCRKLRECGGEGGKPGPCPTGRREEPNQQRPQAASRTTTPSPAEENGLKVPTSEKETKVLANAVRKAAVRRYGKDLRNKCGDVSNGIYAAFYGNSELWSGSYPGPHQEGGFHYIAKVRDHFIDVTADQFGGSKITVMSEEQRRSSPLYANFKRDKVAEENAYSASDITTDAQRQQFLREMGGQKARHFKAMLPAQKQSAAIKSISECDHGQNKGKPGPCPSPTSQTPEPSQNPTSASDSDRTGANARSHVINSIVGGAQSMKAAATQYAARIGSAAWDKLPPKVQTALAKSYAVGKAIEHRVMIGFHKTRALAVEAAKQRGLSPEYADKVGKILGTIDVVSAWTVNMPATFAATGSMTAAKAASWVPMASLAYVAYSTARNPMATMRAAKSLVGKKTHESLHEAEKDESGHCHDDKGHWAACDAPGAIKSDGTPANANRDKPAQVPAQKLSPKKKAEQIKKLQAMQQYYEKGSENWREIENELTQLKGPVAEQPPANTLRGFGKKWRAQLSPEEKDSLVDYTLNSDAVNGKLRSGFGGGNQVNAMDAAIARSTLPEEAILWRGMSHDPGLKRGDSFGDSAFVSTSADRGIAEEFAKGGVLFSIKAPKGAHAADMEGLSPSYGSESEILLPRNSQFRVTGRRRAGGVTVYEVQLVTN